MTAQPIANPQRGLQVHGRAFDEFAQVRACERLGPGFELKTAVGGGHDGQAAAIDGNAIAELRVAGQFSTLQDKPLAGWFG